MNKVGVSEAFHGRFPVSCEHVSADETKLPVAREKKPLVPRVLLPPPPLKKKRFFVGCLSLLGSNLTVIRGYLITFLKESCFQ